MCVLYVNPQTYILHTYMHARRHANIHTDICTHACTHTYIRTFIHIYILTYTHTLKTCPHQHSLKRIFSFSHFLHISIFHILLLCISPAILLIIPSMLSFVDVLQKPVGLVLDEDKFICLFWCFELLSSFLKIIYGQKHAWKLHVFISVVN